MPKLRRIEIAIKVIGILLAILSLIASRFDDQNIWMIFASSSLVALWFSYIVGSIKSDKYFSDVDILLKNIPGNDKHALLAHLLRSQSFNENDINDICWAVYSRFILSKNASITNKISEVLKVIETKEICIRGWDEIYHFMGWFLLITAKEGSTYKATASEAELKRKESDEFLMNVSKRYAKYVVRIFIIYDKDIFKGITEGVKESLNAQLKDGAKLMVYFKKDDSPVPNFGIYGSLAVGKLNENTITNVFSFNRKEIESENIIFESIIEQSKDLTNYI